VRHLHRAAPEVPLIVIAASDDKERATECLHEGAMDYLLKGFMDEKTLRRVLINALEQNTLAGLTDFLRDPVTGLYIRDGFLTLGARQIEAARQGGGTMVLLCALYENLEATRAEFGLAPAERSLCEAARILSGCFRRTDLVARIGDGQFAGLAVNLPESSASALRQRIEGRFAMLNQESGPCGPVEMRISMGAWNAKDSKTFPEILDAVEVGLRNASQALEAVPAIRGAEVRG
jgi:GGDEF domain-containing protein